MARNEPSALQIVLDEVRALRADVRIELTALRVDLGSTSKKADDAHKRIDGHENRFWGWIIGTGLGTGGIGAALAKWFG